MSNQIEINTNRVTDKLDIKISEDTNKLNEFQKTNQQL